MLKALIKKLGIADQDDAQAIVEAPEAVASVVEMVAAVDEFAALQAAFTEQASQVVALTSALAEAATLLAGFKAEKELAELAAHESKMAARMATIVANIGESKADAFLSATNMLDDAAFEAVAAALAGSVKQEASTALFKEVGVEAKADASKEVAESEEMQILKAKYMAPAK